VETSSGSAARELKRRYDQYLGVGIDVRSPYAITAFVNQHGKQMYRVGSVSKLAYLPTTLISRHVTVSVTPLHLPRKQSQKSHPPSTRLITARPKADRV